MKGAEMKGAAMKGGGLLLGAALLALAVTGCKRQDMYTQNRVQTWDRSRFFADGLGMRAPVPGTVARETAPPAAPPAVIDAALLARGQERFDIFCAPCHGRAGDGHGMIVERGFPGPTSFAASPLREAPATRFYAAMTKGYGEMAPFADRIDPPDRWAIVAYIRALQRSQNTEVASLPADDRARLEALK